MPNRKPLHTLAALLITGLLVVGCRNPHAERDRRHAAFDEAAKQYGSDCPASATAGDADKSRQCQQEHDRLIRSFQQMEAADHE